MPKIIDHTGEKFNRLLVLKLTGKRGNGRLCLVRCDCGAEKEIVQSMLTHKTKPIRSCGCLAKDNHYRVHERSQHKFFHIWNGIVGRCYRESQKSYKDYGGRGITLCDEWKHNSSAFIDWLEKNGYRKGYQLDRIDNDGPYSPDNCQIITPKENSNKRRDNVYYEVDGEQLTIAQLAEKYDIKYATLYKRIKITGMAPVEAVNMKAWQRAQSVGGKSNVQS
jgi:hypothetical protein